MENLMWIVTALSITGTILNIHKKQICFVIWTFTNGIWCVYNWHIWEYPQAALFAVYLGLSIWGLIKWGSEK